MRDHKTKRKKGRLETLEKIIQDFTKEQFKYNHPENIKFSKYNNKFNNLVEMAYTLKEQNKIQEAIGKYKEAINWAGAIIDLHKHIEFKKTNPQYYKVRNILWFISGILLIMLFGALPFGTILDIKWFFIGDLIAIMIVICLFMYNIFRFRKQA